VRRLDSIDPATELAWLKVVVRHEALAIRRARTEAAPLEGNDLSERLAAPGAGVDERAERDERPARSLEALARLKHDERTALLLKAQGFSYQEIGERLG
jgi:DNA-directed RNA polymerase specialized sigma24 family protein